MSTSVCVCVAGDEIHVQAKLQFGLAIFYVGLTVERSIASV